MSLADGYSSQALAKALKAYVPGGFDAPKPSLDEEMKRLVKEHGAEQVLEAAKKATKRKRGRKAETDWKILAPIIRHDAELWLDGEDPFASPRTNYAIARSVAEAGPVHYAQSTFRRIMRKLSANRKLFVLAIAEAKSHTERPFADHIRVLRALVEHRPQEPWDYWLRQAELELERYRARRGEPEPTMTYAEIEKANSGNALQLLQGNGLTGLLGSEPKGQ